MRGQKGITLVALIITIIVLVILAGVAIGSMQGTNIFTKAKEAANKDNGARVNENTTLNDYANSINNYLN